MTRRRGTQGAFLSDLLQGMSLGRAGQPDIRVLHWWIHRVPPRVSENAWPVRLRQGRLIVHTKTSAWANDLYYMRDELLASAKAYLPPRLIQDIQLREGPMTGRIPAADVGPTETD